MPVGGERGGSASLRDVHAQPSDLPRAIAVSSLHSARAAVFQFCFVTVICFFFCVCFVSACYFLLFFRLCTFLFSASCLAVS